MSEIRKLFKLLLNKDFYETHRHQIPKGAFDDIGQELLPTLEEAHANFNRNLTANELLLVHLAKHPVITTANRNTLEAYTESVDQEADLQPDIAELVFKNMWRSEVGRFVAQYGIRLSDGQYSDVDALTRYLSNVGDGFVPSHFSESVTTDPVALFEKLNQQGKWKFNIPYLNNRIQHVSPGNFIIILARPESGKTAAIITAIAGKEGFAAQGANVHLLANEEGADATAGRAMCCYNEISFQEARQNPRRLCTEGWNQIKPRLTFVHSPEISLVQLDQYLKVHKPDVVVVDQLDHLVTPASFDGGHERLGYIYRRARELASIHQCVLIGVSQASAEAENCSKVTFAMAEGSKTSKAAAADVIIGIGKTADTGEEGGTCGPAQQQQQHQNKGWRIRFLFC